MEDSLVGESQAHGLVGGGREGSERSHLILATSSGTALSTEVGSRQSRCALVTSTRRFNVIEKSS